MNNVIMSVENMTNMSYIMFAISGVFTITAVVLFFLLDIAKCWRMVAGSYTVRRRKRYKTDKTLRSQSIPTEKISQSEVFAGEESVQETKLLAYDGENGTGMLDTIGLELLQDIVYMQDTTEIG